MSQPIHHHWVPQFYLRRFATPDTATTKNPKVWIFSKDYDDGDPRLMSIRKICGRRYLYSPIGPDGCREWALESKLAGLESTLTEVWSILATGYVDFSQHESIRKLLALFIAILYLRHPDTLKESSELHNEIVRAWDQFPKKSDGTPAISNIEMDGNMYDLDIGDWETFRNWNRNDDHRFFTGLIERDAIFLAELLLKKRWSVVYADRPAFITTDKPVGKQHQSTKRFGFRTEGTIISFPLSPTRLLVLDNMHKEPADQYYPLDENIIGSINLMIWRSSSKFMISPRNTDEVLLEMVSWADRYEASQA
jgi:hypothetical protein